MFSKSKRFDDKVNTIPAVGQYDISKGLTTQAKAALFPKDKRFKDTEIVKRDERNALDTSGCSSTNFKITGFANDVVFLTPRKPCGLAKTKIEPDQIASDEMKKLSLRIRELEEDMTKLRDENETLRSINVMKNLNENDKNEMNSNLAGLKNQVEKLQKEVEDELRKNKELVNERINYEWSMKTIQTDLDASKTQLQAMREQMNTLEKMNSEMTENRDDLENQCSKLHDMNLGLQKEKLECHHRMNEIEVELARVTIEKDELLLMDGQRQLEIENLKECMEEKTLSVKTLSEEKRLLETSINSYKAEKQEIDNSLKKQLETIDNLKCEKESLLLSLNNVKLECEQEVFRLKDLVARKSNEYFEIQKHCEELSKQIVQVQHDKLSEMETLTRELEESKSQLVVSARECKQLSDNMKDMKQEQDDLSNIRLKLEQELEIINDEKNTLLRQLSYSQEENDLFRKKEKEQSLALKILKENFEDLQNNYKMAINSRSELEIIEKRLVNLQLQNSSLAAAEEKASKLKQEFGRRLIDAQKTITVKELELEKCKNELEKFHVEYENDESWKRKFQELEEKIAPFQEQLDMYELEKQALLNSNTKSQSEMEKLGQEYARLLGHQNQKQKVRHVVKLKEENMILRKDLEKLQVQADKEKLLRKRLEDKLSKATGTKRFDPSLAFKHAPLQEKENNQTKKHVE